MKNDFPRKWLSSSAFNFQSKRKWTPTILVISKGQCVVTTIKFATRPFRRSSMLHFVQSWWKSAGLLTFDSLERTYCLLLCQRKWKIKKTEGHSVLCTHRRKEVQLSFPNRIRVHRSWNMTQMQSQRHTTGRLKSTHLSIEKWLLRSIPLSIL